MNKTIQILRPQTIQLSELEVIDLELLTHPQLLSISKELLRALTHTKTSTLVPKTLKTASTHSKSKGNHTLGIKRGTTSKYHYVDRIPSGKYRARIVISGINHALGNYTRENDAGNAVDDFLDLQGDTRRPRNYNKFPELQGGTSE